MQGPFENPGGTLKWINLLKSERRTTYGELNKMSEQHDPLTGERSVEEEFPNLLKKVDKKYHDYIDSIVKNPIRQFQKSSVDDYLKLMEENGIGHAVAYAYDARDYMKGNAWEQAQMNVMNSILPPVKVAGEILKQAIEEKNPTAVKWFPEANGNPKEIKEAMEPLLESEDEMCKLWAAIHLSKHAADTDGLEAVLTSGLKKDWIAYKLENSSSGVTGKGECAKALSRLGDKAKPACDELENQLKSETIDAADASEIAGTLFQLTKNLNMVLANLANVAERVLTAKRGFGLHGGDREMLKSLKNLIQKWKDASDKDNSLEDKVKMLESEIAYHLN